jgi:rubrerythrin
MCCAIHRQTPRYLKLLTRVVHTDNSVTTYWRCPSCSHVQIEETPPDDGNVK